MLKHGRVATRLPAQDLERARAFYADKLGLEPAEEWEGGLRYVGASGEFALFESAGSASGDHTQMGWEVDDIEATVGELRARGVVFEEYDLPGLTTIDGIAEIEGNYASKGIGERGAWFATARATCSGSVSRCGAENLEIRRFRLAARGRALPAASRCPARAGPGPRVRRRRRHTRSGSAPLRRGWT